MAEIGYGVSGFDLRVVRLRHIWTEPFSTGNIWLVQGSERAALIDTRSSVYRPED
jgi:hypothetical protein